MNYISRFLFIPVLLIFVFASCSKKDSVSGLPAIQAENNRSTGASANELLSAARYQSVKVEIQYMPGYQPDAGTITNISAFLNSYLNKPGGISIVQTQIPASGATTHSLNDIALIEKNNRTVYTNGSELGVYVLISNSAYDQANVLGIAFRNTSISLFGKTLHENSGAIGQVSRTRLESTVLEHELGHLLGLVDIGSPMQTPHKDAAHGNHCNNPDCLMYYASETTDILGFLLTGAIPVLDANCKADLRANGGR